MLCVFKLQEFIMAIYGGHEVVAQHNGDVYKIKVKEGVRGMNKPVSATLINDTWHVSFQEKPLTVVEVIKLVPEQSKPTT